MTKEIKKTAEVAIRKYDIAKPEQVTAMANVLKDYITKNGLTSDIMGKKYPMVEGWMFAGFLIGVMAVVDSVENLSIAGEIKWKATVKLMKRDQQVGFGIALCSNKEGKKKGFDEYAILSMAQTRAIGKAYRNMLGFVMKMAGYDATPAEEMKAPEAGAKDMVSEAERMITTTKSIKNLETIGNRIMNSKKFTDEQKKELEKKVMDRLNELEHVQG